MKKVFYSQRAVQFIKKLDAPVKKRFKMKIESLAMGKSRGIFLKKPLQNYQKARVGGYRIVFTERSKDVLYIDNIEHRSSVYKG